VIVSGGTDPTMLFAIADRIIARVSAPIPFHGAEARVSASVGIVRASDMANPDPARILAASDRALYAAKHAGRARAVLLPAPLD
jgi:GGDEF domain-containing protein